MKLGIGVVGHQARQMMAEQLAEQTGANYLSIDDGSLGAAANHIRVWTHLASLETDWTLVLEDDAVPVPDFITHAQTALQFAPTGVVSFYLGRIRPPQWQRRIRDSITKAETAGTAWITSPRLLHAVAVAISASHIPAMLHRVQRATIMPIDEAISDWVRIERVGPISYTWPSLVNHRDAPTLITQRRDRAARIPGRTAHKVGVPTNWATEPVAMYRSHR